MVCLFPTLACSPIHLSYNKLNLFAEIIGYQMRLASQEGLARTVLTPASLLARGVSELSLCFLLAPSGAFSAVQ